jgi:polyferredoxin
MLAVMALGLFMLMISVGAAFWLGEILGKVYYGFLCVGGFYGVLGLVLYFILHKWVKERTSDAIITRILN